MLLVAALVLVARRTAIVSTAAILGGLPLWFGQPQPACASGDDAEAVFRGAVRAAVLESPPLAGQLVRLAFHDAIRRDGALGGADGSVRLELADAENVHLGGAVRVVEECVRDLPLSFADAVALAGAQAVETASGPRIAVRPLGRIDADEPTPSLLSHPILRRPGEDSRDEVTRTMPQPGLSTVGLRRYFARLGFDDGDIVALSGVHAMGRHVTLLNMTSKCLKNLTRACLEEAPVRAPFVAAAVDTFDNAYFNRLLDWDRRDLDRGAAFFIPTDVVLVLDPGFKKWVEIYARDQGTYRRSFTAAYQKLVRLWIIMDSPACCL